MSRFRADGEDCENWVKIGTASAAPADLRSRPKISPKYISDLPFDPAGAFPCLADSDEGRQPIEISKLS